MRGRGSKTAIAPATRNETREVFIFANLIAATCKIYNTKTLLRSTQRVAGFRAHNATYMTHSIITYALQNSSKIGRLAAGQDTIPSRCILPLPVRI